MPRRAAAGRTRRSYLWIARRTDHPQHRSAPRPTDGVIARSRTDVVVIAVGRLIEVQVVLRARGSPTGLDRLVVGLVALLTQSLRRHLDVIGLVTFFSEGIRRHLDVVGLLAFFSQGLRGDHSVVGLIAFLPETPAS